MPKLVFSSDDFPPHLSSGGRIGAWRDLLDNALARAEIDALPDTPFEARLELALLGNVGIAGFRGTFRHQHRTRTTVAADGRDAQFLIINLAPEPTQIVQNGREAVVGAGSAALYGEGEVSSLAWRGFSQTLCVGVPREALAAAIGTPEDHWGRAIDATSEPLRLLKSYAETSMTTGGPDDPLAKQVIAGHLVDLVALSLGPSLGAGHSAQSGLRAGRLNMILAEINAGFADPSFSAQALAGKLRLSVRTLYDLVHQTGTGFGERVIELRLQRAWRLLTLTHYRHRKVTDIALSSGFNDVSYFNRAFRARFGMTPSNARAIAAAGGWAAPLESGDVRLFWRGEA